MNCCDRPRHCAVANADPAPAAAEPFYVGCPRHRAFLGEYVLYGLGSLIVIGLPFLFWRWLKTRSERWTISSERIERTSGVLTRRTDSLELWRVRDLTYVETFADRLVGDGRIIIYSSDASDPRLTVIGLPDHRRIYEQLRTAVEAQRRRNRVLNVDDG